MSESSGDAPRDIGPSAARPSRLQHVTVEREDVAVCTLFPREGDEEAVSTRWITATTDSFVALEQRR